MTTSSPVRAEPGEARVAGDCADTSFDQLSTNGVGSTRGNTADRWLTTLLILLIRLWQIGPSAVLPPSCRYSPSCSAYAIEAVRRYGAARGGWLAIKRIARCHPWGGCGHDPVP